jgi:Holliday junction resolvase
MGNGRASARGGASRYYKGRSREYRAMGSLRADGWLCSRSAASHGPVDIFAGKGGKVLLVQVKGDRAVGERERMELVRWAKAYGARAEVWHFGRSGIEREVVYEPMPLQRAAPPRLSRPPASDIPSCPSTSGASARPSSRGP